MSIATLDHCGILAEATTGSLTTMLGVVVTPVGDPAAAPLGDEGMVLAVVSLVGDVEWSVFLAIPRATSEQLAEMFAGCAIPFASDDMADAMGELSNIVGGQVKALLDARGVGAEISLPTVLRTRDAHILGRHDMQEHKVHFNTSVGPMVTGVVHAA